MSNIKTKKEKWQKIRFGDFVNTSPVTKLDRGETYSFIPMEILDGQNKYPIGVRYKKFFGSGAKFTNGDTIFARITPCLENGKIAQVRDLVEGVGFGSTEYFVFRNKEGVSDADFLYYLLRSDVIRDPAIKSMVGASGRQRADKKVIDNLEIKVPNLKTQNKIADILSTYDELINNSIRRINILEDLVQSIFKEWFVYFRFPGHEKIKMINSKSDFGKIPEGWEIKKLGERINIKRGKNITKNTITAGETPVVAGGINPAYFHNESNVSGPAITISASGANSGYVKLYYQDIWASDCSFINGDVTDFVYYYYLLLKTRQVEVTNLQRGSAQPHVYPKDLMNLLIVDPKENLLQEFEKTVKPIFEMIFNLKKQNNKLKKIRDLLLPKLTTGEIEVI
jgi:type I restriction enzyme S subunit